MTPHPERPLILASSSPYRRALLERLRIPFEVQVPAIVETPREGEGPASTALRLAVEKARAVAALRPGALVIGSDQVATFDGKQIGKPGDHRSALVQLQAMRGRVVEFHSALCVFDAARDDAQIKDIITRVKFRDLPDELLDAYLHAEQPYDCAGSAKAEGLGIALLESIDSNDPTALIGLPLIELVSMLTHAGFPVLRV
ncbi:m(7)GTP pyrophosphatase [Pararobbsia alpina]|uniref:Maf-like protein n=1 Tax=Pararobbsia alpina TaxID=621374 RepID=UPI0039A70F1D